MTGSAGETSARLPTANGLIDNGDKVGDGDQRASKKPRHGPAQYLRDRFGVRARHKLDHRRVAAGDSL
jgi:hypothetical protein